MVKIQQSDNKNLIMVSSKSKGDTVLAKSDSSLYYSNLSKEWACKMPASVDGVEYSAKYYMEKTKQNALSSKAEIEAIFEQNVSDLESLKDNALTALENAGDGIIDSATAIYNNTSSLVSGIPSLLSQTADINLSNITQTANNKIKGVVAADLNNKADVGGSNINQSFSTNLVANMSDTANIYMSGLGMPSDTYIDLTLGASGSTYTAPANGWFVFSKLATANFQYALLKNTTTGDLESFGITSNGSGTSIFLPAKKNDEIGLTYTTGGALVRFRFVYAQGSESEAN